MSEFVFDPKAYLNRIGFEGEVSPSLESLKALHQAQFFTLPFENFDIQLSKNIELDSSKIFDKLVHHKRGGYCFELNALFLMALKHFGFEARALLSRVHKLDAPTGRGHQFTLVYLEGKSWIADLGFGGGTPREPIEIKLNTPVTLRDQQKIQLIETQLYGTMVQSFKEDQWQDLYSFNLDYVFAGDIDHGNFYSCHSPDSFFTYSRIASLPIQGGNISLLNHRIKKTIHGKSTEIILDEDETYIPALKKYFGIELDAKLKDLKPLSS